MAAAAALRSHSKPEIEIALPCSSWRESCADVEGLVETAARRALDRAPAQAGRIIVGITLTDDAEQRRLNRDYRGHDAPTNVLAFPVEAPQARLPAGAPLLLGDVVLAFETVAREAAAQGKPVADHLRHLVVHGVLHLLGHDHEGAADAAIMEAVETEILAGLGVPDPYADTM